MIVDFTKSERSFFKETRAGRLLLRLFPRMISRYCNYRLNRCKQRFDQAELNGYLEEETEKAYQMVQEEAFLEPELESLMVWSATGVQGESVPVKVRICRSDEQLYLEYNGLRSTSREEILKAVGRDCGIDEDSVNQLETHGALHDRQFSDIPVRLPDEQSMCFAMWAVNICAVFNNCPCWIHPDGHNCLALAFIYEIVGGFSFCNVEWTDDDEEEENGAAA